MVAMFGFFCLGYQISTGVGDLGLESTGRLGLGYHQLRFLDRYRSRRYTHFRDLVPAPAKMAHVHQPRRRSNDAFRGYLRDDFPRRARRSGLDGGAVPRPLPNNWHRRRISAARSSGTSLRFPTYFSVSISFGIPAWFRTSRRCEIGHDEDQEIPLWNFRSGLARFEPQLWRH